MVIQNLAVQMENSAHNGDSPASRYPFMNSPKFVIGAVILYLLMVVFGPRFMENRKPFKLRGLLIGYNFFAVLLAVHMMWEYFACSFLNPNFHLLCEDVRESNTSPISTRILNVMWLYWFSKIIEFADTMFFILRKKNNQISFLHTYHHASMAILQWMGFHYVPIGYSYFGAMLNCFVHTLMYSYYMLSAIGPHMQKYLWWKKYLTAMQLTQFVLIICNGFVVYKVCDFPNRYPSAGFFMSINNTYLMTLFSLFLHFYLKSYNNNNNKNSSNNNNNNNNTKKSYVNGKTE